MNGSMISRYARRACLDAALVALSATVSIAGDGVYQMDDGLLVVEFESADLVGDWVLEQAVGDHTGSGYLRWSGADFFTQPGNGVFGLDVHVPDGGTYDLRPPHEAWDMAQDNRDIWSHLREFGYRPAGGEVPEGPAWSFWRGHTDEMLATLFPPTE